MIFDSTFYNYIYKFENEMKYNNVIKNINYDLVKLFYYTKGTNFKYIQAHSLKFRFILNNINNFNYEII
jgi:hypothetical protein